MAKRSHLRPEEIEEIRELYRTTKLSFNEIAERVGRSDSVVRNVCKRLRLCDQREDGRAEPGRRRDPGPSAKPETKTVTMGALRQQVQERASLPSYGDQAMTFAQAQANAASAVAANQMMGLAYTRPATPPTVEEKLASAERKAKDLQERLDKMYHFALGACGGQSEVLTKLYRGY